MIVTRAFGAKGVSINKKDTIIVLGNFEAYTKLFRDESIPSHCILPDEIIKVLQKDMDERVYDV